MIGRPPDTRCTIRAKANRLAKLPSVNQKGLQPRSGPAKDNSPEVRVNCQIAISQIPSITSVLPTNTHWFGKLEVERSAQRAG